jgi:hypothetical protein
MPWRWRQYPRGYLFRIERVIARCQICGEEFKWLPDDFDMRHRFNRNTHEYCGGVVQMIRSNSGEPPEEAGCHQ